MPLLFSPFFLAVIAEIAGFAIIGGRLGAGLTIVWVFVAFWLGLRLIRRSADDSRAVQAGTREATSFDTLCLFLAGLLLMIPGFISDIAAAFLLLGPARGLLRRYVQAHPGAAAEKFAEQAFERAQRFQNKSPVIDAVYEEVDPDKKP